MKHLCIFLLAALLLASKLPASEREVYGTPGEGRVLVHATSINTAKPGDYWVNPKDGFLWLVEHAFKTPYNEMDLRRVRVIRGTKVFSINTDKLKAFPFALESGDNIIVPVE